MTQQESRALEHTIPHEPPHVPLKPSLIPHQRPCVCMDAVKINAPHQTAPPRSGDTPRSVFVQKVVGGSKKFGAVKFNG
jgi:hypothetical protein